MKKGEHHSGDTEEKQSPQNYLLQNTDDNLRKLFYKMLNDSSLQRKGGKAKRRESGGMKN